MDQNNIENQLFDVPPHITIDILRNEIARLNDERITLATKLQFVNQILESMKNKLEGESDSTTSSSFVESTTQEDIE